MAQQMTLADRFVSWIEIETGVNDKIVITPGADPDVTLTIPAGLYYCYSDDDDERPDTSKFVPLYSTIQDLMTASLTGTWTIESHDNTNSILKARGIKITGAITWSFNTVDSTFPFEYLSFDDTGAANDSSFGVKIGEYSYRGAWSPYTILTKRVDKRGWNENDTRFSDKDTRRTYSLRVSEGVIRTFEYSYLIPECVFSVRASDPEYQPSSIMPDDDENNGLVEFWELWSHGERSVGLRPFLVVHNTGDEDLEVWSHEHEVIIPSNTTQITNFREILSDLNVGGEFYRATFDMWSISGNYKY